MSNEMNKQIPWYLSNWFLILVAVISLFTCFSIPAIILGIIRIVLYKEKRTSAIIIVSCNVAAILLFIIALFTIINYSSETVVEEASVEVEESTIEAKVLEPETETIIEEASEEVVEETIEEVESIYGYSEFEQYVDNSGISMNDIPNRECLLYTYAQLKVLKDNLKLDGIENITSELMNTVSMDLDDLTNPQIVDTMISSYMDMDTFDNPLVSKTKEELVSIAGDEAQDIIDKAVETYYGDINNEAEVSTEIPGLSIDYIKSIENLGQVDTDSVSSLGSKTKEDIYRAVESAYNNPDTEFTVITKDVLRDENNIGTPIYFKANLSYVIPQSNLIGVNIYFDDNAPAVYSYIDTSLIDETFLNGDKLDIGAVYLGMNSSNSPIFYAIHIDQR